MDNYVVIRHNMSYYTYLEGLNVFPTINIAMQFMTAKLVLHENIPLSSTIVLGVGTFKVFGPSSKGLVPFSPIQMQE